MAESGYAVEVRIEPQGEGAFLGTATVRDGTGKVLAAPAVKTVNGKAAETESSEPNTHRTVRFRFEVKDRNSAAYSVEIQVHGIVVSRHTAGVDLER